MTAIVTPDQMVQSEDLAIQGGTSAQQLMRIAAGQIADWVDANVPALGESLRQVTGLIGPGNNGGDTLAALGILSSLGWSCSALFVGRNETGELPVDQSLIDQVAIVEDETQFLISDVVLDGIFGNGARASLPEEIELVTRAANDAANQSGALRVAIDCPTGVDSRTGAVGDTPFCADVTLCIGYPKIGLFLSPAADYTGELEILDIGLNLPGDFSGPRLIEQLMVQPLLPVRSAFAHKRAVGSLLVVGGAPGYYGAPRLAAEAAYRIGAGLVGLAVPRQIIPSIAVQLPEAIYHPVNDANPRQAAADIQELLSKDQQRYSAVVVGPGLSQDKPAAELMLNLFSSRAASTAPVFGFAGSEQNKTGGTESVSFPGSIPILIDADGLNWLAEQDNWNELLSGSQAVLTPHPGEFSRLSGVPVGEVMKNPFESASDAAKAWNQVVVLKCGYPCVGLPDGSVWVCPRAPSELATAGTGDVLAGIIGGLLAQGLSPADAARAGLFIGATAGRNAREDWGVLSVMARDVILELPIALAEVSGNSRGVL